MANKKYLDETGLTTLWEIIKTALAAKVDNTLAGSPNGLATLDSNGHIPLDQLKNLDTTFAEVLTALPTSNIKRHLYLIKSTDTTDENVYIEYLYTGELPIVTDSTASNYSTNKYDSAKWEKLGEYKADIDLSPYALKTQTIGDFTIGGSSSGGLEIIYHNLNKANGSANKLGSFTVPYADSSKAGVMSATDKSHLDASVKSVTPKQLTDNVTLTTTNNVGGTSTVGLGSATQEKAGVMTATDKQNLDGSYSIAQVDTTAEDVKVSLTTNDSTTDTLTIGAATTSNAGVMSASQAKKLSNIAENANNYSLPTASSTILGGVKIGTNVSIDNNGVLSAKDTTYNNATTSAAGLMSNKDKLKLDSIADNANNYTLPTASSDTLGGIKVGDSFSIKDSILSVNTLTVSEINEICQ